MEMIYKTYKEYYDICDRLSRLPRCTYIPSDHDLDYMSDFCKETFEFMVYIVEYHDETIDDYARQQIKKAEDILYDRLELEEEEKE